MDQVTAAFGMQAQWCRQLGSVLYAELLERAGNDIDTGGPIAGLVQGWQGDPVAGALALRMMAGVHAAVLAGEEPGLGRHYPSVGGAPVWPEVWRDFRDVVARREDLPAWLAAPVQTNEVNRCAAVLGAMHALADRTGGLPLRLFEIGASAGLCLLFDGYRYDLGETTWGPHDAPEVVVSGWEGQPPGYPATLEVVERHGCDIAPFDLDRAQDRTRLRAYVWADQPDRHRRLTAAIDLARASDVTVAQAAAGDWVTTPALRPVAGTITVLLHTVMWQYLPQQERDRIDATVQELAATASREAPLARLTVEPGGTQGMDIAMTVWPGGQRHVLGVTDGHARHIAWHR